MALRTKSILKEIDSNDGIRISVMSRHTLNDGVTPDSRITADSYTVHYAELAPAPKLIGDYYKRGLPWEDFEIRFKEQISLSPVAMDRMKEISQLALHGNVTLLCIEETAEKCHRRLIAEICQSLSPWLIIEHH